MRSGTHFASHFLRRGRDLDACVYGVHGGRFETGCSGLWYAFRRSSCYDEPGAIESNEIEYALFEWLCVCVGVQELHYGGVRALIYCCHLVSRCPNKPRSADEK